MLNFLLQQTTTTPQTTPKPTAKVIPDSTFTRPCDLKTDLYVLQPERLNSSSPLKVCLKNFF